MSGGDPLPSSKSATTLHTYLQPEQQVSDPSVGSEYRLPFGGASLAKPSASDESFLIDLPPMSQLDASVLEALPDALRDQILRSYEKSIKKEDKPTIRELTDKEEQGIRSLLAAERESSVHEPDINPPVNHSTSHNIDPIKASVGDFPLKQESLLEDRLIIDNEYEFLREFRKYIREWISCFKEGPNEGDAVKFADFFVSFTESHLEQTQIMLRFLRHLILQLESPGWALYFNSLLAKVQNVTKLYSGGTFNITELII